MVVRVVGGGGGGIVGAAAMQQTETIFKGATLYSSNSSFTTLLVFDRVTRMCCNSPSDHTVHTPQPRLSGTLSQNFAVTGYATEGAL